MRDHFIKRRLDGFHITVMILMKVRGVVVKLQVEKELDSFIRKTCKHRNSPAFRSFESGKRKQTLVYFLIETGFEPVISMLCSSGWQTPA